MSAAPAQLEELKSLNSRIEQFNEQMRKEGPVIDQIQEQRTKAAKLERQVKAGRLRKMSLVRHGAKGRGIHKRKPPKQAGELEAIYDEMDSLEDSLDKIEELKDKRLTYIERRRAVLKEMGIKPRVSPQTAEKIAQQKKQLQFLEESIEKIRRARKLLKRASSTMKSAKQHLTKAKDSAFVDLMVGGGVIGAISTYKKHKSMKRAGTAMAPAKRYIREANKLLKSLDLKGASVGAGIPQLSVFMDVVFDGWIVDGDIHDKIAKAELNAEMSVNRLKRRAKQLETVEEAFRQQHYRTENGIYELYLDAESTEAARAVRGAQSQ
jgi:prefoldin subunit 5